MPIEDNDTKGWNYSEEKQTKSHDDGKPKKYEYDLWINLKPNAKPPTKRKIRVRLASTPIHYGMHWMAFHPLAPEKKANAIKTKFYKFKEQELDAAWNEGGWQPMPRHACWAFDREDPNHIKILDGSNDLFNPIGEWALENNINPAGLNGTDWVITVDNNKAGKAEIVSILPGVATPFTDVEKNLLENNKMSIEKMLKIKDKNEIRALWLSLPDDKKYNPKNPKYEGKTFNSEVVQKRFSELDAELAKREAELEKRKKQAEEPLKESVKPEIKETAKTASESKPSEKNTDDDKPSHEDDGGNPGIDEQEPDLPF